MTCRECFCHFSSSNQLFTQQSWRIVCSPSFSHSIELSRSQVGNEKGEKIYRLRGLRVLRLLSTRRQSPSCLWLIRPAADSTNRQLTIDITLPRAHLIGSILKCECTTHQSPRAAIITTKSKVPQWLAQQPSNVYRLWWWLMSERHWISSVNVDAECAANESRCFFLSLCCR